MRVATQIDLCGLGGAIGAMTMVFGFLAFVVGFLYATVGVDNIDPLLATTRDSWVLFLFTHNKGIIISGFCMLIGGGAIQASFDWRKKQLSKRNYFIKRRAA